MAQEREVNRNVRTYQTSRKRRATARTARRALRWCGTRRALRRGMNAIEFAAAVEVAADEKQGGGFGEVRGATGSDLAAHSTQRGAFRLVSIRGVETKVALTDGVVRLGAAVRPAKSADQLNTEHADRAAFLRDLDR